MPKNSAPTASKGRSWGLERRLQFIDFRLRWEGNINRTDLTTFFGLSIPQASLDISKYTEIAPNNLFYDRSAKTYVATPSYRPVYPQSSALRYLEELLAMRSGVLEPDASFIGSAPEVDWSHTPSIAIDEQTVTTLVKAIRKKLAVWVSYQSLLHYEATLSLISPHALAHDGFRWYVRAFCNTQQQFCNFALNRILRIDGIEPSVEEPATDKHWQTHVTLILAPHPSLSPVQKRILELDYGMKEGEASLRCRQAFLRHTLKRLGLQTKEQDELNNSQLILKNRSVLQPYIDALPESI